MQVRILVVAIVVLCAAPLHAARVTGELIAERGTGMGVVTLNAPNFSIRSVFSRFLSFFGPLESECNLFGCGPGDLVSMDGIMIGTDMVASGTIDGVFYPVVSHGSAATLFNSAFFFNGPAITLSDQLVYVVPIEFQGTLTGYVDTNICLLCQQVGGEEMPLRVNGSGRATLTLAPRDVPGDGGPWMFERVVYRLEVPEPSTFALVCTALAAYVMTRLFSRTPAQPIRVAKANGICAAPRLPIK